MASTLINTGLDLDPSLVLLTQNTQDYTRAKFRLILQVMTAAKQTMAGAWKSPKLCIVETKHRHAQTIIHSKTEATIQDKVPKYL